MPYHLRAIPLLAMLGALLAACAAPPDPPLTPTASLPDVPATVAPSPAPSAPAARQYELGRAGVTVGWVPGASSPWSSVAPSPYQPRLARTR